MCVFMGIIALCMTHTLGTAFGHILLETKFTNLKYLIFYSNKLLHILIDRLVLKGA